MKKTYQAPSIEKVSFCYKDQVVASGTCGAYITHIKGLDPNVCYGGETQTIWDNAPV